MARISMSFSGWLHDVPVNKAMNIKTGKMVNVRKMSGEDLVKALKSGKLALDFGECFDNSTDYECEICDYEEHIGETEEDYNED